ncbi:MAG: TetR/AcrR family transcriptional regulator [Specibacter sp.]
MVSLTGRPRNTALDGALIRAAGELIVERGFAGVSVGAIASRAKTTRPAFYRRFEGIPEVVLAVLMEHFATNLDQSINTGNLPDDLEAIQRDQVQLFMSPLVLFSLAGFLDAVRVDEQLRSVFVRKFLAPRRAGVAAVIARAVGRREIPACPDVEWICDLLTGPVLMRVLMPGLNGLDESFIVQSVASVLSALGYSNPTGGTKDHG